MPSMLLNFLITAKGPFRSGEMPERRTGTELDHPYHPRPLLYPRMGNERTGRTGCEKGSDIGGDSKSSGTLQTRGHALAPPALRADPTIMACVPPPLGLKKYATAARLEGQGETRIITALVHQTTVAPGLGRWHVDHSCGVSISLALSPLPVTDDSY
jgi:hypothetical protein